QPRVLSTAVRHPAARPQCGLCRSEFTVSLQPAPQLSRRPRDGQRDRPGHDQPVCLRQGNRSGNRRARTWRSSESGASGPYDPAGRRLQAAGSWARTWLPQAVASATYDATNQLTLWGQRTMSYDPDGNLASDGQTSYSWNARNQLASLSGLV